MSAVAKKPGTTKRRHKARGKARVLVVDDHPVVRQGLRLLIDHESDLKVCAEAETVADALEAITKHKPDVAVVDLSLRGTSGLELIKDIRVRHADLPVLVLSMSDESVYAERVLRAGASGYLMKEAATEEVLTALRRVLDGGIYLSDAMASRLLAQLVRGVPADGGSPVDRLSDRELEVFGLIGRGLGTGEIARRLHLSPRTIETYRTHIKQKLNLADAAELLQRAIYYVRESEGGS